MNSYNDIDRDFLEIMLMKNVLNEDIDGMLSNNYIKYKDNNDKKEVKVKQTKN